jgi:hypothetical protein
MAADDHLSATLTRAHGNLRRELDGALLAACEPQAGVWDRWGAVRLIDAEIRPGLRAERDLVDAVIGAVPPANAEHLWTLGELLEALGDRLCELGRMGQRAVEFTRTAEKYRLAFEYWCRAVERSVGPLGAGTIPGKLVHRLEQTAERPSAV